MYKYMCTRIKNHFAEARRARILASAQELLSSRAALSCDRKLQSERESARQQYEIGTGRGRAPTFKNESYT